MSRRSLTKRQRDVLEAIERLTARHGYPPTIRELADEVGLRSTSSVHEHLDALEHHKLLDRRPGCPRAIRLTTSA